MNHFKHTNFNIRFINKGGKGNRSFSTRRIGEYHEQNKTHEIYFRPEEPCYILLDLDHHPTLGILNAVVKHKAFLIIQTSQTRYHAWFYDPNVTDWNKYEKVAKSLARKFGGDLGATNKKQVGRLPNYKNHKRGGYKTRIYYASPTLGILKHNADATTSTSSGSQPPPPSGGGGSMSRYPDMRDWGFINMCLERNPNLGYWDLYRIMRRTSANGHNDTYVRHTVQNVINNFTRK